jgi:hypothetical protein
LIPSRVQLIRKLLESSRINAVHLIKHKPCRTLVGLSRPSTPLLLKKDGDARNKCGHDDGEVNHLEGNCYPRVAAWIARALGRGGAGRLVLKPRDPRR